MPPKKSKACSLVRLSTFCLLGTAVVVTVIHSSELLWSPTTDASVIEHSVDQSSASVSTPDKKEDATPVALPGQDAGEGTEQAASSVQEDQGADAEPVEAEAARRTPEVALEKGMYAVVRPFWKKELKVLADWMLDENVMDPCDGRKLPVDLVLYYSGYETDGMEDYGGRRISKVMDSLTARATTSKCFVQVRTKYAHLGNEVKYPFSACFQFTRMWSYFTHSLFGYKAIYYMEMDVFPLRANWLGEMFPYMEEAGNGSNRVWVIGGTTDEKCMDRMNVRTNKEFRGNAHINGNAVYSSAEKYKAKVIAHESLCNKPYSAGAAYDYKMWFDDRRNANINFKWRAINLIKNCKPSQSHKKAAFTTTISKEKLMFKYPDALMVHSSYDLVRCKTPAEKGCDTK